jgi:hypothetical protein
LRSLDWRLSSSLCCFCEAGRCLFERSTCYRRWARCWSARSATAGDRNSRHIRRVLVLGDRVPLLLLPAACCASQPAACRCGVRRRHVGRPQKHPRRRLLRADDKPRGECASDRSAESRAQPPGKGRGQDDRQARRPGTPSAAVATGSTPQPIRGAQPPRTPAIAAA